MYDTLQAELKARLDHIRASGLYKNERVLDTPQHQKVGVYGGNKVLNLCANNYLGLSNHKEVIAAAQDALAKWGYGLSSARFICGTQVIHKDLERQLSDFLRTDDTILYSSCFDANGGLFETLLDSEDAVISDELNHASIIDGIRLSKAQRYRYRHSDMHDLREKLEQTQGARHRLIATDGVFSMDGEYANLPEICALAERYRALAMIDDSHAVGFVGLDGRGTHEQQNVIGKIDIITGTLGKALGGASGGYTSGRKEIIEYLRQRSRPYLFSNSMAPPIVATSLQVLNLVRRNSELRDRLRGNTVFFRERMTALGFKIPAGDHPIVPIMLGEATLAARMADRLLSKGVYVIAFSFPVVPHGEARIRVQISAAHSREDLEFAARKFAETRAELAV